MSDNHEQIIAAILTAATLIASGKSCSATRAVSEFRSVLDALTGRSPDIRSSSPPRRDAAPAIEWVHPEA